MGVANWGCFRQASEGTQMAIRYSNNIIEHFAEPHCFLMSAGAPYLHWLFSGKVDLAFGACLFLL